jgi:hypothetical protein
MVDLRSLFTMVTIHIWLYANYRFAVHVHVSSIIREPVEPRICWRFTELTNLSCTTILQKAPPTILDTPIGPTRKTNWWGPLVRFKPPSFSTSFFLSFPIRMHRSSPNLCMLLQQGYSSRWHRRVRPPSYSTSSSPLSFTCSDLVKNVATTPDTI